MEQSYNAYTAWRERIIYDQISTKKPKKTKDGSGDQVGKTGHDFPEILFLEKKIGQFKKFLRISTALTERNLSANFFLILSIFSKFRF